MIQNFHAEIRSYTTYLIYVKKSPFDLTVKTLRYNLLLYNTMDGSPLTKNTYQLI
jgi:hypothetical protein